LFGAKSLKIKDGLERADEVCGKKQHQTVPGSQKTKSDP